MRQSHGVGNTATTTFAYAAGDSRVVRDTEAAQTFYAFGFYEYEIDKATDARTERSTYAVAGERVAVREQVTNPASDELTWTFSDNLGSASGFLNETTGETGAQRYYPFGHQRVGSATDLNPTDHGYTGQIRDGATGVYFYNARYYDQHKGRFLAADTIIPNPANPADYNRYSYVRNNPINYNDPTGHCPSNSECYEEAMRYVAGAPALSGCSETTGYDVGCRVSVDGQTVGFIGYVENVTGNGAGDVLHFFDSCNPVGGFASVSDCRVEFDWGIATGIVAGLGCTAAAGGTIASGGLAGGAAVFACGAAAAAIGTVTSNVQYGRSWHTNVARNAIIGGVADLLLFGGGRLIATHLCSFAGETEVLMADGTTKPISEIEIGDWVHAEDPQTGESGARQVTQLWVHHDTIIDLEIDGIDIATTPDHPFWNATDFEWQRADALDSGDLVLAADGDTLTVAGMDWASVRTTTAYNLTVDDIHTYFVAAGSEHVLVHNSCSIRSLLRSSELPGGSHSGGNLRYLAPTDLKPGNGLPRSGRGYVDRSGAF